MVSGWREGYRVWPIFFYDRARRTVATIKRFRQMAAVFGGETWLLAVFGFFPVSEAAGSGTIIS
jgi:hypothetical protein